MKITVRYLGQARRAAGVAVEEMDTIRGSAATLVQTLAARHGEALTSLLLTSTGQPRASTLLFVGDEQIEPDRTLADGEVLTILSPMAGG